MGVGNLSADDIRDFGPWLDPRDLLPTDSARRINYLRGEEEVGVGAIFGLGGGSAFWKPETASVRARLRTKPRPRTKSFGPTSNTFSPRSVFELIDYLAILLAIRVTIALFDTPAVRQDRKNLTGE